MLLKKEKTSGQQLIDKYFKDASYLLPHLDESQEFISVDTEEELLKVTPGWVKDLCPSGFISMQQVELLIMLIMKIQE